MMTPPYTDQVPGPYEDTTCQMVVAYGARHHPHLDTMREFRDAVMEPRYIGRVLVDWYYRISQLTAPRTARSRILQVLTRYSIAYPAYLVARCGLSASR